MCAAPRRAFWLVRNDPRLHDNATLTAAAAWATDGLLPVFVFDARQYGPAAASRHLAIARASPARCRFQLEAVECLREKLRGSFGAQLVVRCGNPAAVLLHLSEEEGVSVVYAGRETCAEELGVDEEIRQAGLELRTVWDSTMLHPSDIPYSDLARDLPMNFTRFRRWVEAEERWLVRAECGPPVGLKPLSLSDATDIGNMPSLDMLRGPRSEMDVDGEFDDRAVLRFVGGEDAALARVKAYIWTDNLLSSYKDTRNGMVGAGYSSKFSAWLSQGSLSPRRVYWEVKRYEGARVANESTYWMVFELLVR